MSEFCFYVKILHLNIASCGVVLFFSFEGYLKLKETSTQALCTAS
jgi:hypothetical protein